MSLPGIEPVVWWFLRPIGRGCTYFVVRRELARRLKVLPGPWRYVADRWWIDHEGRDFTAQAFLTLVRSDTSRRWVERYLRAGIDPAVYSEDMEGPLHLAVGHRADGILELLLTETRLDVNARSVTGDTPLILAARKGFERSVELLLDHHSNVQARNDLGESALLEAARRGHEAIVRRLEKAGASEPDLAAVVDRWRALRSIEEAGLDFEKESFLDCVEKQRPEWVKAFVNAGIPTSARRHGETALHLAIRHQDRSMADLLLRLTGSELLEARNEAGDTPLILAAHHGQEEIVKLLLDRDARIKAHNNQDDSALVVAARNGHWGTFELLRVRGATESDLAPKIARIRLEHAGFHARPEELFETIEQGRLQEVAWLLEAGIDRRARTAGGENPLTFAVRRGTDEIVELLLRQGDFDLEARDRNGDTALIVAARAGKDRAVERLLEHGASVHARNAEGESALFEAARGGHAAIVRLLEDRGASEPNLAVRLARWRARREIDQSEHDFTQEAFLWLIRTGETSWVERFLRAGIDLNRRDESFSTPLHVAASLPAPEVLQVLLETGDSDVDASNAAGDTPLIVAAREGREQAARLLLDHGSNVHARNREGASALFEAARRGHAAIGRLLEDRNASEPDLARRVARSQLEKAGLFTAEELVRAARQGERERVAELLLAGRAVNALGDRDETALHAAVRFRRTAVVELLLKNSDLDLEALDGHGVRAVELAAGRGFDDLVALLVERGAQFDVRAAVRERLDQRGYGDLRRVDFVRLAATGQRELVVLFLDAGVSPDTLDDFGKSALVEAARGGRADVVELLLERGATADLADQSGVRAVEAAQAAGHGPLAALLQRRGAAPVDPRRHALAAAVAQGDLAAVRTALETGVSPDQCSERGEPALVAAARRGSAAVVLLLLERGADASQADREGRAALLAGAEAGRTEVLERLLEHRVNLEVASPDGATALILAAHHGHLGAVRVLLEAGADAGARDARGRTALLAAQTAGHPAIVELLAAQGERESLEAELLAASARDDVEAVRTLLGRGADPEVPDAEGNTPLARAAARGLTSVVEALLDAEADIDSVNGEGRTPLMLAAAAGREETVALLLDRRAAIDRTDLEGATALLLAAAAGRGRTVALLAQGRADPSRGAGGTTPLVEISRHGHLEAARALIEAGAEVDQQVAFGFSAWMTAALAGHEKLLELLEAKGALRGREEARLFLAARRGDETGLPASLPDDVAIDAQDRDGWTALMVATAAGHDGVAERLLEAGSDPDATDRTGSTRPLLLAAGSGHVGTLELLLERARQDPPMDARALLVAARNGHAEVVRLLVDRRRAAVDGSKAGGIPLVAAADKGHYQAVRALLDLGADLKRRTPAGVNALMAAKLNGHDRIVELLLDHGARDGLHESRLLLAATAGKVDQIERLLSAAEPPDLHARDDRGRTALMLSCAGGHREAADALLGHERSESARQAAASAQDALGRTTLMWSARGGNRGIVRRLLDLKADPGALSKRGRTALLDACRQGDPGVVALLLQELEPGEVRRAAVNHQDENGATPLLEALTASRAAHSWKHLRVVELLLAEGAEQGRSEGELVRAIRRGDVAAARDLLPRLDLARLALGGKPLLHLAVESGSEDMVGLILSQGVDVDAADPREVTALMAAAGKGRPEIVRLLLAAHADLNRVDAGESSALIEAIAHGRESIVRQLVEAGADLNQRNQAGHTPLLLAVHEQKEPLVRVLLDGSRSLRLDDQDLQGRTALALARLHGQATGTLEADLPAPGARVPKKLAGRLLPIESGLVEAGARAGWNDAELILAVRPGGGGPSRKLLDAADVHVRDLDGGTPLLLACRSGDLETASALLDRGAAAGARDDHGRTALMEAARAGELALVEKLMGNQLRLDLDAQDETGETALLEAASAGCDELVGFLIDRGASVQTGNEEGETPLIRAAGHCGRETVQKILQHDTNACARTKGYRTAVTEAAIAGREPVLELLLVELGRRLLSKNDKRRTVINAVDRTSRTALDWAVAEGHVGCAKLLREHGGTSVTETDFMVYTTPDGDCYHRHDCPAIHIARSRETLEQRFMREAIQEDYEFCDRCTPSLEPIDWKC